MTAIQSNPLKILVLILISAVVFTAWQNGAEKIYANFLVGTTNVVLKMVKDDTHIELEKKDKNSDLMQYRVFTRIEGRAGNYPQETGGIMQPFVLVLSWQLFLFLALNWKKALNATVVNIVAFLLIQVIFLILLTGYYSSEVQKSLFTIMLDSFYVFALVLVIKDQMLYGVFKKKVKTANQ